MRRACGQWSKIEIWRESSKNFEKSVNKYLTDIENAESQLEVRHCFTYVNQGFTLNR